MPKTSKKIILDSFGSFGSFDLELNLILDSFGSFDLELNLIVVFFLGLLNRVIWGK